MKRLLYLFNLLFVMPLVFADDCGLMNLASCLPQKMYDFFLSILNAPLKPLLDLTKALLTEPVQLSLFLSLWAIILYVLSLFYGILLLYSGFNFMISGHDAAKRANAKEWFKNLFVMIVLIQASYFLYSFCVDIGSLLTSGVINLIDPQFFMITADNIVNIGLELMFVLVYVVTLLLAVLLLTLRYIIIAVGVVLVPIGIFCYFIIPLREYGKLILNFLGICIFITFFDSLVFLACSRLILIPLFANIKILVMITAFNIANMLMFYLMLFSAVKSAFSSGKRSVGFVKDVVAAVKFFV